MSKWDYLEVFIITGLGMGLAFAVLIAGIIGS